MLMVFQRGTSAEQKARMSVMMRMDGRGGKIQDFWAMYSLRMSFWMVPPRSFQPAPCSSPTQR